MDDANQTQSRRSVLKSLSIGAASISGATGLAQATQPKPKPGRAVAYVDYDLDRDTGRVPEGEVFDLVSKIGEQTITCQQAPHAKSIPVTSWSAFGSGPFSTLHVQSNSLKLEERNLLKVVNIIGHCPDDEDRSKVHLEKIDENVEE